MKMNYKVPLTSKIIWSYIFNILRVALHNTLLIFNLLWENNAILIEKLSDPIYFSYFKNLYSFFLRVGRSVWRRADCEN